MAFPNYVLTRTVSVGGAAILESSDPLRIRLTITASKSLIHAESGYRYKNLSFQTTSEAGTDAVAVLPRTDMSGWKDARTGDIIDVTADGSYTHQYMALVEYLDADGNSKGIAPDQIGPFIVPAGTGAIDLDKLVPVGSSSGESISFPAYWDELVQQAQASAAAAQAALLDSADFIGSEIARSGSPAEQALLPKIDAAVTAKGGGKVTVLAPWLEVFRADPSTAKIALVGPSTVDIAAAGSARHARWKRNISVGGPLAGMADSNILNFGYNGQTGDQITSPSHMADLAAAAPGLICASGLLINTIRQTPWNLPALTAALITYIERIRAARPGTPIILETGNPLLTTDVGGLGYVTPNSDAAAKSEMIRQAHLNVIGKWPEVIVRDVMTEVYGGSVFATHPYMADQLHPNSTGMDAEVDALVPLVGYVPPAAPGRITAARASSPYAPWTVYGREVEDPTRYLTVASVGFSNMASGSYLDIGFSYSARGNIQRGDIIQLPDGTAFVYEAGITLGTPGGDVLRLSGGGIPTRPASLVNNRGTVRILRRTAAVDAAANAALVDSSWRFKRVGFVAVAPNGTTLDIRAGSARAQVETQPASEWAVAAGDRVYIDGMGGSFFTVGTDATAITSGSNLRLSGLASADRSSLLYRMAVVVGSHADAVVGPPGDAGPAGGLGSPPTTGRDLIPIVFGAVSASAGTNGVEYAVPILPLANCNLSALAVEVGTAVAGATVRLGVRSSTGYLPGAVLTDAGTVDASSVGLKSTTVSQALTAGSLYWLVASLAGAGAANLKTIAGTSPFITLRSGTPGELGASSYYASRGTTDAALVSSGPFLPSNWAPLIRATVV